MNKQRENTPEQNDITQILEIYKTYLQMVDKISDRRQTANSFYLTINTVIVGLISYLSLGTDMKNVDPYYIPISIAGMVICYHWYRLIRLYSDLNSGKFKVVHEIEKLLPVSPYDDEWDKLGRGKDKSLYLPFTHIEMRIPWIFLMLHFIVFANSITGLVVYLMFNNFK